MGERPVRRVLVMAIENVILGTLATAAGLVGGWFLLSLIIATRIAKTVPDIYIKPYVSEIEAVRYAGLRYCVLWLGSPPDMAAPHTMNLPGALR
jgi:hypothetical protein